MTRQRRRNMRLVAVSGGDAGTPSALFASRCSAIYQLYSIQLELGDPIKATTSWTTIGVIDRLPPETPSVINDEPPDNLGVGDNIFVPVDFEILNADRRQWAHLYLDWLHSRMIELARARGWNEAPLEAARLGCIAAGLRVDLEGKTQRSPDRKFKAQMDLSIDVVRGHRIALTLFDKVGTVVGQTISNDPCLFHDFRTSAVRLWWGKA